MAVLAVVAVMVCLLLPALAGTNNRALRVQCAANLKQVSLAFHVWANDNYGYPPQTWAGNINYPYLSGGQLVSGWPVPPANAQFTGQSCPYTFLVYGSMSNELNTPKVLVCPADDRLARTNFGTDFGSLYISTGGHNGSVSYFVGRDAYPNRPKMFLAGDRDICSDTTVAVIQNNNYGLSPDSTGPQNQGCIAGFGTNTAFLAGTFHVGWSPIRMHQGFGNVTLEDGSVQQLNSAGLVQALVHSGDTGTSSGAPNVLLFP